MHCFEKGLSLPTHSQIAEEIDAFRKLYGKLIPAVFLSYEREAYSMKDGTDFRVTFDENILYRTDNFSLQSPAFGTSIIDKNKTIMEIKTSGGMPLWMTHTLAKQRIYPMSFSKYGTAYIQMEENKLKGDINYA